MNFTGAALGAVLAVLAIQGGTALTPVVAFMKIEDVQRTDETITGRVIGRKIKNCPIVGNSFVGWQKRAGIWEEVSGFEFLNDASPNSSKPSSIANQSFGLWRWHGIAEDATAVRLTLLHNCGGDAVITKITFDI